MPTDSSRPRRIFTLPELLAAAVITTLAIALAPLFYPVIIVTHDYGNPRTCISNLKQLGLGMMMYAQDYDERYPFYHPDPKSDWGAGHWGANGETAAHFHSSSLWIAQLRPYIKDQSVYRCPKDANPERNQTSVTVPGSETPFPVSYGPNRMFVNPAAYGRRSRPVSLADVVRPETKYLLGDCVTARGFDLDTIAFLRYPNYDPSLRQNGWSLDQFTALGRVAWPDKEVESVTRHEMGSNIVLADGHTKWLRHNEIPNNDGRGGRQYRLLAGAVVPWQ